MYYMDNFKVDVYVGIGGAPEGVLAAAAIKCFGGQFQGRLVISDNDEKLRATKLGITDMKKKYYLNDIIKGDVIFCAAGVTDGEMLKGIRVEGLNFLSNPQPHSQTLYSFENKFGRYIRGTHVPPIYLGQYWLGI